MKNPVVGFLLLLTSVLGVFFGIHFFLSDSLELAEMQKHLIATYLFNYVFTILAFVILFLLRKRYESSLGFIFMISSFLKFGLFFVFFHPIFKADDVVSKMEFLSFFIPYSISLIIEIYSFSKVLSKQ